MNTTCDWVDGNIRIRTVGRPIEGDVVNRGGGADTRKEVVEARIKVGGTMYVDGRQSCLLGFNTERGERKHNRAWDGPAGEGEGDERMEGLCGGLEDELSRIR